MQEQVYFFAGFEPEGSLGIEIIRSVYSTSHTHKILSVKPM
jgi:hypothetical protein